MQQGFLRNQSKGGLVLFQQTCVLYILVPISHHFNLLSKLFIAEFLSHLFVKISLLQQAESGYGSETHLPKVGSVLSLTSLPSVQSSSSFKVFAFIYMIDDYGKDDGLEVV